MELFIGVSGGHQKSTAVALSSSSVLCCVKGESLDLHTIHYAQAADRLGVLLETLAYRLNIPSSRMAEQTIKLVAALPGAATENDQLLAELCFNLNGWTDKTKFRIVDDTWAGLIGGLLKPSGICAFAGTGASVFVGTGDFPFGKKHKMDGWGPILGDFGSGFQLVMDFFRFLGRSIDRGYIPSLFHELVKQEPKISSIDNVQHWFDQLYILHQNYWRIRFASLAQAITSAADRESDADPDAIILVKNAARDMAQTIEIALQRFGPESETLPIVFQGGMFEYSNLYRQTVKDILKESHSNDMRMASFRTAFGAGILAYSAPSLIPDEVTLSLLIKSINALPYREQISLKYTVS